MFMNDLVNLQPFIGMQLEYISYEIRTVPLSLRFKNLKTLYVHIYIYMSTHIHNCQYRTIHVIYYIVYKNFYIISAHESYYT